LLFPLPGV